MKKNRFKTRNNYAISEVFSVILMLTVTVSIFVTVSYLILDDPGPTQESSTIIYGKLKNNTFIIEPTMGSALSLKTICKLEIGGITNTYRASDLLDSKAKQDGEWNIGERAVCHLGNFSYFKVSFQIVSPEQDLVLWDELIQDGVTSKYPYIVVTLNPTKLKNDSADLWLGYNFGDKTGSVRFSYKELGENWINTTWIAKSSYGTYNKTINGLLSNKIYIYRAQLICESNIINGEEIPILLNKVTFVNTIIPYNISSSPLTILAAGPSDLDKVKLYYRWSEDNISWSGGLEPVSIFDGFESGSLNTSLWNKYSSSVHGRNEINNEQQHSGSQAWLMAVDSDGNYTLNELYTVYDFTGTRDINIEFWHYDSTDEENDAPASWSDHTDADAVSFTNDGTTWFEIIDAATLNNDDTWAKFSYNISSHPNFDSDVTSNFAIKFQQYDNYGFYAPNYYDGRLWDDILIECTRGKEDIAFKLWNDDGNPDISYPWSWNFDFPEGDGYYEFYSIGEYSDYYEVTPETADALCYCKSGTKVDPIIPFNQTISPTTITATGKSNYDNVVLYYRFSNDNTSWEVGSGGSTVWSSELLTNPSFETGSMTGWSNAGGGTMTVGTDCPWGSNSPYDGSYYIYCLASGGNVNGYVYQDVDLSGYATNIDAGKAEINVTGWLVSDEYNFGAPPPYDEFFMNVKFYDGSDGLIGGYGYESGGTNPISQGSGNHISSWALYGITNYDIPVGARKVKVSFYTWEYDGSSFYDAGSADDFSVKVGINDGSSDWIEVGTDSSYPWSWNFNFPDGTGYYGFYSIGKIVSPPEDEELPSMADAICKKN